MELISLDPTLLTQVGGNDLYDDPPPARPSLPRLQLFSSGKLVDQGEIEPGHYGSVDLEEIVMDFGTAIDVLPLARRPMAMDFSGPEVVVTGDYNSKEFKRIAARARDQDCRCQCGTSFLLFERSSQFFFDFYCGKPTYRGPARQLRQYLPLTKADIKLRALTAEPRGPTPATLTSKLIKREFSWRIPVVNKCSKRFAKLPLPEHFTEVIRRFVDPARGRLMELGVAPQQRDPQASKRSNQPIS